MSERINAPRDREALIDDFFELTGYGVATEEAARRLGVTPELVAVWVKSRHTEARRRANRLAVEAS